MKAYYHALFALLASAVIAFDIILILGIIGVWDFPPTASAATLPQSPALFETSLQSRISSTDTSMTLVANSVRGGSALSGYNCFTVDEGRSDQEFVCGTISGTSVTGLTRGLDPLTATTTNTSIRFAHRVGADVKVTDFPILAILRHQANGSDVFPNLLTYANTVLMGVGTPTTTLATKYYVDTQTSSGCSFADLVTKGCVEIATQNEAASSTALGSTLSTLVIAASTATDTPNTGTRATRVLMSDMTGFLKQGWLNLGEAFAYTGTSTWTGTAGRIGVGTTTPYLPLSIAGSGVFGATTTASVYVATSTSATSTFPAILSTMASSTNLSTTNACKGCIAGNGAGYLIWQVPFNCSGGGGPNPVSATITCPAGKVVVSGGYNNAGLNSNFNMTQNYPSATSTWQITGNCGNGLTTAGTAYAICVNP